eukprot:CAMPEP_0185576088 /NCGR_PEP_ID=MMETSP0434-20130131/7105_1 /TAXON_ID=626734 ORGANISM="Favella taraikaensis, Strain Fe Narragansett Bay" /NCGR_SAMPLE_ID=MMETSP0434 /ASSEMBLY_ACC=CAM_ASM_000379 /LENGTH=46 /DNA_ID= /DNA_START= /DNA_END= /DNA_ORIENTATION=
MAAASNQAGAGNPATAAATAAKKEEKWQESEFWGVFQHVLSDQSDT